MSVIELAIDIGTSYITIFQRGKGVVFKEPTVAIGAKRKNKLELTETGLDAKKALLSSLGNAQVIFPIRESIVVHQEAAGLLMKSFIKKLIPERLFKPTIKALVMVSSSLTVVERRAVEQMLTRSGIKEVMMVESPLALLAYTNSVGGLFVDIGGGTTDVAGVTRRGIAAGSTVNIAGCLLNTKIIDYIADKYGLKIGEFTAENLKVNVGSMYDNDVNFMSINGRDRLNGEARMLEATAKDVKKAVVPAIDSLIEVIKNAADTCPPELATEIRKKGVFICGGTAKMPGLTEYISVRLDLPVTELVDITEAVAIGGGRLIDDRSLLNSLLNLKK